MPPKRGRGRGSRNGSTRGTGVSAAKKFKSDCTDQAVNPSDLIDAAVVEAIQEREDEMVVHASASHELQLNGVNGVTHDSDQTNAAQDDVNEYIEGPGQGAKKNPSKAPNKKKAEQKAKRTGKKMDLVEDKHDKDEMVVDAFESHDEKQQQQLNGVTHDSSDQIVDNSEELSYPLEVPQKKLTKAANKKKPDQKTQKAKRTGKKMDVVEGEEDEIVVHIEQQQQLNDVNGSHQIEGPLNQVTKRKQIRTTSRKKKVDTGPVVQPQLRVALDMLGDGANGLQAGEGTNELPAEQPNVEVTKAIPLKTTSRKKKVDTGPVVQPQLKVDLDMLGEGANGLQAGEGTNELPAEQPNVEVNKAIPLKNMARKSYYSPPQRTEETETPPSEEQLVQSATETASSVKAPAKRGRGRGRGRRK